jgi:hypothetical protein
MGQRNLAVIQVRKKNMNEIFLLLVDACNEPISSMILHPATKHTLSPLLSSSFCLQIP